MSAYIIVDTKISDATAYEKYKKLAKPIAEKYGGIYKVRGGSIDVLENELWTPTRVVVIEFPTIEKAREFIDSDEYAPVKLIRQANAECTLFIVESS